MTTWILGAALLAPASAVAAEPSAPTRVLVLGYRADGSASAIPDANAGLAARLGKVPGVTAVAGADFKDMAGFQALRQHLGGAQDADVVIALGRMAGAGKVAAGTLAEANGAVVATLSLVDVASGAVDKRVAGSVPPDQAAALVAAQSDAVAAHVQEALAPAPPPPPAPKPAEAAPPPPKPAEEPGADSAAGKPRQPLPGKQVPGPRYSYATVVAAGAVAGALAFAATSAISGMIIWAWQDSSRVDLLRPTFGMPSTRITVDGSGPGPLVVFGTAGTAALVAAGISGVVLVVSLVMDRDGSP